MAEWKYINLEMIVPDSLENTIGAINTGTSSILASITTIRSFLEPIKALAPTPTNPFVIIFQSLLNELQDSIEALFTSGFSYIIISPFDVQNPAYQEWGERRFIRGGRRGQRVTSADLGLSDDYIPIISNPIPILPPEEFMRILRRSFNDLGDEKRPQYTGSAGGILFLTATPDIETALSDIRDLYRFFNLDQIERELARLFAKLNIERVSFTYLDVNIETSSITKNIGLRDGQKFYFTRVEGDRSPDPLRQYTTYYALQSEYGIRVCASYQDYLDGKYIQLLDRGYSDFATYNLPYRSSLPDWEGLNLKSIAPFDQIYRGLIRIIETLRAYATQKSNAIKRVIRAIDNKIDDLERVVQSINDIINGMYDAFTSSGFYVLSIPPQSGGVNYLLSQLQLPPDLANNRNLNYCFGLMLTAGGAVGDDLSVESIKTLQDLLGV